MIRERLSEYKNFPGIFREVFFIFYCRLTEFSRNKTLLEGTATKLPFAEFPLTFFPFSLCVGSLSFPTGFFVLFFAKIPRFPLRGSLSFRRWFSHPFISRIFCFPLWDFPALSLRFFPSLSPRGFSILPRGVFLFFPAFFSSVMQQKNSPDYPGSFRSFYIF